MKKTMITAAILFGTVGVAQADARGDLALDMRSFAGEAKDATWHAGDVAKRREPKVCRDAVAAAKKAGVEDADTVAGTTCDDYAAAYAYQTLRADVQIAYDLADWMTMVTPDEAGNQKGMSQKPQACLDALEAMGKGGGDVIALEKGKQATVDEARAVCTQALEDSKKFEGAVTGRETAEHDKIEAVYKAVGIKGKRLELFTYYGMPEGGSFLAVGCHDFVTTAKGLKKAKKLFIWLTADDGEVTVRKYTFKGDSYKTTDTTYLTEARAYRGCK